MDRYRLMLFDLAEQVNQNIAAKIAYYYKLPASVHDKLEGGNAGAQLIKSLEERLIIREDEDKLRSFHATLRAMRYFHLAEIVEELYPQLKQAAVCLDAADTPSYSPSVNPAESNPAGDVSETAAKGIPAAVCLDAADTPSYSPSVNPAESNPAGDVSETAAKGIPAAVCLDAADTPSYSPSVNPAGDVSETSAKGIPATVVLERSNTPTCPPTQEPAESNSIGDISETGDEGFPAVSLKIKMDVYLSEVLRKCMNKMEEELDPMDVIDDLITHNIMSVEDKTVLGSIDRQECRVRQFISKLQESSRQAFYVFLKVLQKCGSCDDIVQELKEGEKLAKKTWVENITGILTYLGGNERFIFCEMVCSMAETMTKREAAKLSDYFKFSKQEEIIIKKSENRGFKVVELLLEKGFFKAVDESSLEDTLKKLTLTNFGKILQNYRESLEQPVLEIHITCPHQYLVSREDKFSFFEIGRLLSATLMGKPFYAIYEDFTRENSVLLRIPSLSSLKAVQEGVHSGTLAKHLMPLLMTKHFQENVDGLQATCDEEQCTGLREHFLKDANGKTEGNSTILSETEFHSYLAGVGLDGFYPAKMTLQMATKIRELHRCKTNSSIKKSDIPLLFLSMLTSLDRRVVLPEMLNFDVSVRDFICALVLCSDDFLKQHILEKLAASQLAVPVIIPTPTGGPPTFHLWALRRIVKKWKCDEDSLTPERNIVTEPLFTVAFFRVGKVSVSKSHILNNMFGRAQSNATVAYFISKREDNQHDATFSKGLLEAHWYVPLSGKEGEILNKLTLFLNLRGDSNAFPQQVDFACKVANLVFVIVQEECELQNKEVTDRIQHLSTKVIIVSLKKLLENTNSQTSTKLTVGKNRVEYEVDDEDILLSKQLCKIIKTTSDCSSSKNYKCIEDWKHIYLSLDSEIIVDENGTLFERALSKTEEIFKEMKSLTVHQIKEKHMPLQKLELEWVKWDQKRSTRNEGHTIEYQEDNIRQKKLKIRQQQLERGLTREMKTLYHTLHDVTVGENKSLLHYFMAYFQAQIEKKVKKEIPPHVNKIRNLEIKLMKKKKQKKAIENCKGNTITLEKEIAKLQADILSESKEYNHKHMGVEHFLREFSHLFEAQTLHSNKYLNATSNTTALAVQLLLEGYPLEVLDGDSAYISINWISTVLDAVNKALNSPKVFAISVIGVQSSGKSTLLNCMFGVRFNVRAGKCTRGLFLQMLEVDGELQESFGFQYVLIIDTEGLQSPDRMVHNYFKFDNTLATLAMSIADLSILNISQETIGADMIGILQIAAHALIRMRKVQLVSRCRIIHQRVSDVHAAAENKSSMNVIKDVLDKAAIAAAKEENITGIKEFSDVFPFTENDNLYIPCLWMGNMSPPNHAYSETILDLKCQLLSMIGDKTNIKVEQFTLKKFISRLEDVWDALKKEDFVFNFQNSFNALSYQRFRLEHNKWIAVMRTALIDWELRNKENVKEGNLEVYKGNLRKEINLHLEKVRKEIDEYVRSHSDEDEVIRQTNTFKISSENIAKEIEEAVLDNFRYFLKTEKEKASLPNFIKECKTMLRDKAKEKALMVRQSDLSLDVKSSLESLDGMFETLWEDTAEKLKTAYEEMKVKEEVIISACENSLTTLLDNTTYNRKFQIIIKDRGGRIVIPQEHPTNLVVHTTFEELPKGAIKQPKEKRKAWHILDNYILRCFSGKDDNDRHLNRKQQIQNIAFEELANFVADDRYEAFDKNRIHKFFDTFFENLRNYVKLEEKFSLQTLVNMCQDIAHLSIEKQRNFEEKFSLYKLMVMEKPSLKTDFLTFFDNTIITERVAEKTYSELLNKIRVKLLDHLNVKLLDRLRKSNCFIDREYMIGTILCELCKRAEGQDYLTFIRNGNNYVTSWIQRKIVQETTVEENSELWIVRSASDKLNHLKQIIEKCLTKTKGLFEEEMSRGEDSSASALKISEDGTTSRECSIQISVWQNVFVQMCREEDLVIDLGPMIFDSIHYISFTEILLARIKARFVSIENLDLGLESCKNAEDAEQLISKMEIKPHLEILKHVQGCSEVCPFCRVGCHRQGKHKTHSATLHYPQGLAGFRDIESKELVVDICTSLVASDATYKFKKEEKFRPYRNYKKEFPTWDIKPIKGDQPTKHWQWVMSNFNDYVAKHFQTKPGVIPVGWKEIEQNEALSSLKQYYNLD